MTGVHDRRGCQPALDWTCGTCGHAKVNAASKTAIQAGGSRGGTDRLRALHQGGAIGADAQFVVERDLEGQRKRQYQDARKGGAKMRQQGYDHLATREYYGSSCLPNEPEH